MLCLNTMENTMFVGYVAKLNVTFSSWGQSMLLHVHIQEPAEPFRA